jgi:ribosomal protein L7/L12
MSEFDQDLPPQVVAALERGQKIEAIKLLRELKGIGLKEAKEAVDDYMPG